MIPREKIKAAAWGGAATLLLAGLIVLGSRNLAHFDAAMIGYTFATMFAAFGIGYRYAMWLQRPPIGLLPPLRGGFRLGHASQGFDPGGTATGLPLRTAGDRRRTLPVSLPALPAVTARPEPG